MGRSEGRRRPQATRRSERKGFAIATAGVLGLLACAGLYRQVLGAGPAAAIGGPFTLADSEGRPRSDTSFHGRYVLLFFGYTHCADVCPRTLTEMSEALDQFDPDARRVQPVFITIDPARDTPDRLRHYITGFSAHLVGLTGTTRQLDAVERLFHVVVEPDRAGGRDDFDHSAVIYLLDPQGNFLAPIPAEASRAVMQSTLHRLVT